MGRFEELRKNISFLIEGETIIAAEDKEIWDLALQPQQSRKENNCLILGIKGPIARLHTTIKLTKDTGPIVSFQKKAVMTLTVNSKVIMLQYVKRPNLPTRQLSTRCCVEIHATNLR